MRVMGCRCTLINLRWYGLQGEKLMEWAMRKPGQAQFNRFLYDRYVGACVSCE
jgi:hypothetical protein